MSAATCGGCERQLRDGYLCRACAAALGDLYRELPGLVSELATTTYRQDRMVIPGGGSAPRGSRVAPMPFRWQASILLADVQRTLTQVAERHAVPVAAGTPVAALCATLGRQLRHDAASVPFIGVTLTTLDHRAAAMRQMIDLPATHRYLGQCDGCGAELYADRALARFDCPTRDCGAVYDVVARVAELLERSRAVVASAGTIVTALSSLDLRVTEDQITKWRQRGQLAAVTWDGRRFMYRVGDVLDRITAGAQRRGK